VKADIVRGVTTTALSIQCGVDHWRIDGANSAPRFTRPASRSAQLVMPPLQQSTQLTANAEAKCEQGSG
jgi:hypothetical protein